ncbi:MAG: polymer-forming cytoskeletal protein [Planctomycetaceae bacterium]|nr:polymer-forming cytoskeletal protein [Planctomycetaceae bacterium]
MFKDKKNTKTPAPAPAAPVASKPEPSKPEPKAPAKVNNIISEGTVIEGNVMADGDINVNGKVTGDVSTKSQLIIGQTANIQGNITAENADIAGSVNGTVTVSGLLTIRQSSKIDGDVITKNLNVESGSMFTGRFQVGSSTKFTSPGKESVLD